MPKEKYLILSDCQAGHTLKWLKELVKVYDVYAFSLNGFSKEIRSLLGQERTMDGTASVSIAGGNIGVLKCVPKVVALIKRHKPSVINAHYLTSYGTIATLASMISGYSGKLVLSAWGTDILVTPWKNKVYYYLTKFILNRAHLVTSDAEFMSDKIREISPNAKVMTFPFGIEKMPDAIYTDKDENLFFSNRALEPNYNIDKVIDLFCEMHQEDSRRRLIISNDGSQKDYLVKIVESLNLSESVTFVGYLSKPEQAEYYKQCRWFISIPTSDSTSVSLLEAMSYGCVPIVSDLPANKEWVKDGFNGIIYKNSAIDLKSVNWQTAFDKNRDMIRERAIWNNCIAKYISALE